MRIAAPKLDARRRAQQAVAVANRAKGAERPCGIKGCTRHSYKGRLCREHYRMVPLRDKQELMFACMEASMATAARFHRRFLRDVRRRVEGAI